MRGHHDMGGLPAGTCSHDEHDYELWEKRVDALLVLLSANRSCPRPFPWVMRTIFPRLVSHADSTTRSAGTRIIP